jgi:hypothetical protein
MFASILTEVSRTVRGAIYKVKTHRKRSPHWDALRKDYLWWHPKCAACGGYTSVQVHHVAPFHLVPEMELDSDNLISLCMAPGKHCHLLIGHGDNFKYYNPSVRSYAKAALEARASGDLKRLENLEKMSKSNRIKDLSKWNGQKLE